MKALPPVADGNPINLRSCTVPGCGDPFYARNRCVTHWTRWRNGTQGRDPVPVTRRTRMTYTRGGRCV